VNTTAGETGMRGLGAVILVGMLLQGCVAAAAGVVAGAAAGVTDTVLGIAEKTFDETTKLTVNASRKYLMKDRTTATQILSQTADNLAKQA